MMGTGGLMLLFAAQGGRHARGRPSADKTLEPAYVTFALDPEGKVTRMTMKAASPLADFSPIRKGGR